ncbi:MAG: SEC-C metal-binding domain-containing protein [Chthoniobacteraceae bacterium]
MVHGDKHLLEKLGRNDPCPCGSTRSFKSCCMLTGCFRWGGARLLLSANRLRASRAGVQSAHRAALMQ